MDVGTRMYVVLVVLACLFMSPVAACGMGGMSAGGAGAIVAMCVILAPVTAVKAVSGKVKQVTRQREWRKRNSDVLKRTVKRAIRDVGRDNFSTHLQQLYANINNTPSFVNKSKAYFDLGLALFLDRDLIHADDYLSRSLLAADSNSYPGDRECHLAQAHFVKGMINQYLWDFNKAASHFKQSIGLFEDKSLPQLEVPEGATPLTEWDAHNSYGFANALQALYGGVENGEKVEKLNLAIDEYTIALAGSATDQGMWHHNRGVARYFRTYYITNPAPGSIESELQLAESDFLAAINSGNFGTSADGYAMLAQTMTRLKKPETEIQALVKEAFEHDKKVFMINLSSEEELRTPWPLPRQDYPFRKLPHQFKEKSFSSPTWCDHCTEFIFGIQTQGYECEKCNYKVHKKCFPRVKGHNCWNDSTPVTEGANSPATTAGSPTSTTSPTPSGAVEPKSSSPPKAPGSPHVHSLKGVHFHKPTWCQHCGQFVASPFGKQGYRCTICRMEIHKECVKNVKAIIED